MRLMRAAVTATVLAAMSGVGLPSARAEAPAEFTRLRDRAKAIDSLTSFLEKYVGACPDIIERAECKANAKRVRAEMTGKSYYVILTDDTAGRLLKAGAYNPGTREFRIDLTPFFEGGGLALTEGAPIGLDGEGRPRIPLIPVYAVLPPDAMPMDVERLLRTQNIKLHVVFKPLGLWSLSSRGGKVEGVKAKLLAVRLTNARNGEEVALRAWD